MKSFEYRSRRTLSVGKQVCLRNIFSKSLLYALHYFSTKIAHYFMAVPSMHQRFIVVLRKKNAAVLECNSLSWCKQVIRLPEDKNLDRHIHLYHLKYQTHCVRYHIYYKYTTITIYTNICHTGFFMICSGLCRSVKIFSVAF